MLSSRFGPQWLGAGKTILEMLDAKALLEAIAADKRERARRVMEVPDDPRIAGWQCVSLLETPRVRRFRLPITHRLVRTEVALGGKWVLCAAATPEDVEKALREEMERACRQELDLKHPGYTSKEWSEVLRAIDSMIEGLSLKTASPQDLDEIFQAVGLPGAPAGKPQLKVSDRRSQSRE